MIFENVKQGSPEWLAARAGVITASRFSDAISTLTRKSGDKNPGDPTAAADKYAYELAFERISGQPYGEPINAWTLARGHELEPHARLSYEVRTGNLASESGIVLTDDRKFGYSTDGMVDDDGLIEIKCPVDTVKIMEMLTTHDVSEYMHQIQGGMWISGRSYCDFVMYVPALEMAGKALYYQRIKRDDDFIDAMVDKLMQFERRVTQFETQLRA